MHTALGLETPNSQHFLAVGCLCVVFWLQTTDGVTEALEVESGDGAAWLLWLRARRRNYKGF